MTAVVPPVEPLRLWVRRWPEVVWVPFGLAVYVLTAHFLGDRISFGGGLPNDGRVYTELTTSLSDLVSDRAVDSYYVARLLPSAAVWAALKVVGSAITDGDVVSGFAVVDAVVIGAAGWLWMLTMRTMAVSRRAVWIGSMGVFGSFAVLKMTPYYPVLTDTWVLFLGVVLTYGFVASNPIILTGAVFVGGFVHQLITVVGLVLLALPRTRVGDQTGPGLPSWLLGLLAFGATMAIGLYYGVFGDTFRGEPNPMLALGLLAVAGYLTAAAGPLIPPSLLLAPRRLLGLVAVGRLTVGLVAFGLVLGARSYLSANGGPGPDVFYLSDWYRFSHTNFFGDALPLLFVTGLVVYLGPVMGGVALRWREVVRRLTAFGPGAALVTGLAVGMSVYSEARQILVFVPFVVLGLVLALDERPIGGRLLVVLGGLSLLFSKIWLPIPDLTTTDLSVLPNQWYFMNFGPWMSVPAYLIQGVAVVIAVAAVRWALAPPLPESSGGPQP